jgi:very-short-patch-repair endonuclease
MARPTHTRLAAQRASKFRKDLTPAEARLWTYIKGRQLGAHFRRQVPIGPYIADFACLELRLVVEVDDTSHLWKDETVRSEFMESMGYTIVSITNAEMAFALDDVVRALEGVVGSLRAGKDPFGQP